MNTYQILELKFEALGEFPSDVQIESLTCWVMENIPAIEWADVGNRALMMGDYGDMYTDLSMRQMENHAW